MKYIPRTSDPDPKMSQIDIEHQQQTLKLFHGEKSAYDRHYLVGEIIHYHRQHYPNEIVSGDVLTCFYKEFFPKKINDPHDDADAETKHEQYESKNRLDEEPIEPLSELLTIIHTIHHLKNDEKHTNRNAAINVLKQQAEKMANHDHTIEALSTDLNKLYGEFTQFDDLAKKALAIRKQYNNKLGLYPKSNNRKLTIESIETSVAGLYKAYAAGAEASYCKNQLHACITNARKHISNHHRLNGAYQFFRRQCGQRPTESRLARIVAATLGDETTTAAPKP
jgi:hypothetical protein